MRISDWSSDVCSSDLAASAKQLIQRAMSVSGLTAGDLAYEGARRVLDEHERMVLTGADRDAFLDAVSRPPEPTGKLVAALKRTEERRVGKEWFGLCSSRWSPCQ